MSMASTSVSKTESPGSNPCAPAKVFCRAAAWGEMKISFASSQRIKSV